MIVQKFLQWSETAGARERARAANALSRAFVLSELSLEETRAAEAAMALLLDDPSPMVRQAMAEVLAPSARAPRSVICSLAKDQVDIAGIVVCCSPLLGDQELVDLVADGRPGIQSAIAIRHDLRRAVCAALAEVAGRPAVADMLDNPTARMAKVTLRRITERFGDHPDIRARLLDRTDLPGDVRHALIIKVGNALAGSGFVAGVVGDGRIRRIADEACEAATLQLAGAVDSAEMPALVEHLRLAGKLTPAFLMHALCIGNIEFFASAVGSITGVDDRRVRAILVDGRRNAIQALFASGGLDANTCEVFATATLFWRKATTQEAAPNALHITEQLISHYLESGETGRVEELLMLVERMNLEFRRKAAKDYAIAIACEAA